MVESVRDDLGKVQEQLERLMAGQMSLVEKVDRVQALLQSPEPHGSARIHRLQVRHMQDDTADAPWDGHRALEVRDDDGLHVDPLPVNGNPKFRSEHNGMEEEPLDTPPVMGDLTVADFGGNVSRKNLRERDEKKLLDLFKSAEKAEERIRAEAEYQEKGFMHKFTRHHLEMFDSKENFIHWLDSWMGIIIFINAVFIGVAVDYEDPDQPVWLVINLCFCTLFWVELLLKLTIHKPCAHFCGNERFLNIFDASLVLTDTAQLGLTLVSSGGVDGMPSASLFRIVRLLRLLRLVRLSRSEAAKDLINMLTGLLGGIKTLMWSLGLFVITMYVAALVFQELLRGGSDSAHIRRYFETTPRSMFTVFRCSFGDCSDENGTPIFEHVKDKYGSFYALLLCIFLFFVVVGMFNVISAVFVESTLTAAEKMQSVKKAERLQDESLFAVQVARLIKMLLQEQIEQEEETANGHHGRGAPAARLSHHSELSLSQRMVEVMDLSLPCGTINTMAKEAGQFREALNLLDIEPEDHQHLSSILDPDGSGNIDAMEFVNGVERLRGMPRRSDVVSVQLMIRSLQEKVGDLQDQVETKLRQVETYQLEAKVALLELKREVGSGCQPNQLQASALDCFAN